MCAETRQVHSQTEPTASPEGGKEVWHKPAWRPRDRFEQRPIGIPQSAVNRGDPWQVNSMTCWIAPCPECGNTLPERAEGEADIRQVPDPQTHGDHDSKNIKSIRQGCCRQ